MLMKPINAANKCFDPGCCVNSVSSFHTPLALLQANMPKRDRHEAPSGDRVFALVDEALREATLPLSTADLIHYVYGRILDPQPCDAEVTNNSIPSRVGVSQSVQPSRPCRSSRLLSKMDEQQQQKESSCDSNGLSSTGSSEHDPTLTLAALPRRMRELLEGVVCPPPAASTLARDVIADRDDVLQTVAVFVMTYIRRRRAGRRILLKWAGRYLLASREEAITANALITTAYQQLGLTVRQFGASYVMFVEPEAEHRFLMFGTSCLPNAGMGLFLRPGRMVRAGTVLCEYRGRRLPASENPTTHCVRLHSGEAIDGLDDQGVVQSWAPLINDDGPQRANVTLHEFDEYPGRVFIITNTSIMAGSELFVVYGAKYWGAESYTDITVYKDIKKRSTLHGQDGWSITRCRDCDGSFPSRVKKLHQMACADPLTVCMPMALDPLPYNCYTAVDTASIRPTKEELMSATHFVSEHPFTKSNTHVPPPSH
jgi:hypothetical protein